MRFIISGGGTGGHLIPGIALTKALEAEDHYIVYILRKQDMNYGVVYQLKKERLIQISLQGISRKLSFNTFSQIGQIFREWFKTFKKINNNNPDIIIITGGYVSNIAALSAFIMRKPLYILEQNSVAGITNRIWSKYAKCIFTSFPKVLKLPKKKIIYTGNPLLYNIKLTQSQAKEILELPNIDQKIIGISGGSQGSRSINNVILEIIPSLLNIGYQIIWSLGIKEYDYIMNQNILDTIIKKEYKNNIKIFRFINRMDAFWSGSDIVIARSGAGTVSEALYFKKPTIFIPIRNSPDNHQYLNAKFLSEKKCASILEETNLTKEELLIQIENMMINHQEFQKNFSSQDLDATKRIIQNILEL